MSKEQTIYRLWESSDHGTRREDIEAAYAAGAAAERERWEGVEQFLIAAADGSMSRNNSQQLASELLEQVRRSAGG